MMNWINRFAGYRGPASLSRRESHIAGAVLGTPRRKKQLTNPPSHRQILEKDWTQRLWLGCLSPSGVTLSSEALSSHD